MAVSVVFIYRELLYITGDDTRGSFKARVYNTHYTHIEMWETISALDKFYL